MDYYTRVMINDIVQEEGITNLIKEYIGKDKYDKCMEELEYQNYDITFFNDGRSMYSRMGKRVSYLPFKDCLAVLYVPEDTRISSFQHEIYLNNKCNKIEIEYNSAYYYNSDCEYETEEEEDSEYETESEDDDDDM